MLSREELEKIDLFRITATNSIARLVCIQIGNASVLLPKGSSIVVMKPDLDLEEIEAYLQTDSIKVEDEIRLEILRDLHRDGDK